MTMIRQRSMEAIRLVRQCSSSFCFALGPSQAPRVFDRLGTDRQPGLMGLMVGADILDRRWGSFILPLSGLSSVGKKEINISVRRRNLDRESGSGCSELGRWLDSGQCVTLRAPLCSSRVVRGCRCLAYHCMTVVYSHMLHLLYVHQKDSSCSETKTRKLCLRN